MDNFISLFLVLSFFIPLMILCEYGLVKLLKAESKFLPSVIMVIIFFIMFLGITFSLIHSSMSMIDSSDLLQIDATIIAGILILLTIRSFISKKDGQISEIIEKLENKERQVTPISITALIVMPFSVSAILIIIEYGLTQYSLLPSLVEALQPMYLFSTAIGFVYLICFVFLISIRER